MGLIKRVFGRPAAANTASTSSLLKGLATSPGGPVQRDHGLAALGMSRPDSRDVRFLEAEAWRGLPHDLGPIAFGQVPVMALHHFGVSVAKIPGDHVKGRAGHDRETRKRMP